MSAGSGPRAVLVTGASNGVGRAIARAAAARGDRVGLLARNRDALEEVAAEVRERGGEALVLPADVADAEAVDTCADAAARAWGGIDVWVNNAMVTVFAPVQETTADEYRRVTEVTYQGTVHGTLAALRHMRGAGRGTIVQIGSALAYRSIPLQSAYCAAKSAIRGFTDSLRCELAHDGAGIALTMVQLPAVNTPQFEVCRTRLPRRPRPLPPVYQPEVIGRAVMWAMDHPRRELWVGPSTYQAILGQRIAPGVLDRYLARTAYGGQLTDEPAAEGRPDNLERPVPGAGAVHGPFDATSRGHSAQLWLRTHWRAAGAAAFTAAAALVLSRRLLAGDT